MLAERLRDFDLGAFQDADELKGVDHGFALVVIVGDDEGVTRTLADFVDARGPRSQLFRGIKVVVTFMGGDGSIVGEPSVVATAVEADVTHRRSGFGGRFERFSDDGLVDVAETGVALTEEGEGFRNLPGSVAELDNERIVGKAFEDRGEIGNGFARAVEGKRELEKDGAKFFGGAENVEAGADGAFVFGSGLGRGGFRIVSEFLPELGGEDETRISGHAIKPLSGMVGTKGLVERGVDLDRVKEFGEKRCFVKILGAAGRVDVTGPVGIRPSRRADAESCGLGKPRGRRLWRGGAGNALAGARRAGRRSGPRFRHSFRVQIECRVIAEQVRVREAACQIATRIFPLNDGHQDCPGPGTLVCLAHDAVQGRNPRRRTLPKKSLQVHS